MKRREFIKGAALSPLVVLLPAASAEPTDSDLEAMILADLKDAMLYGRSERLFTEADAIRVCREVFSTGGAPQSMWASAQTIQALVAHLK